MTARAWGASRRLEFIDFRLYWHGRINRRDLRETFGISVPQAANDLRAYQEAAPGNAVYDRRLKAYIAGEAFRPAFFSPDATEYFEHLQRTEWAGDQLGQPWAVPGVPFAVSPIVKRKMKPGIVRVVIAAIREQHALRITYQSMRSEDPRTQTISPHAVASDGFRWHARGFVHDRGQFQDFVFARIIDAEVAEAAYVDGSGDDAWHETITVVLSTNPALAPEQRKGYEFDLGMTDAELRVPVRRALLHYFLTEMRLDFDAPGKKPPRVYPLRVINEAETRAALAGA